MEWVEKQKKCENVRKADDLFGHVTALYVLMLVNVRFTYS